MAKLSEIYSNHHGCCIMTERQFIAKDYSGISAAVSYLTGIKVDKPLEIIVRPFKKKRSLNQNALYWQWHICIITPFFRFTKCNGQIEIGLGNHFLEFGW